MAERSKLHKMRIVNIGCIGPEGLEVQLDNILCLVGQNNSGKSTVLRAYELVVGSNATFTEKDICNRIDENPPMIELWIHIPRGTPNIAEKWKIEEEEYLLVRSKWEWIKNNGRFEKVRKTWSPEDDDYLESGNAAGLDTVFESRLPKPFRIGALENPEEEHKKLLELILQPISDKIKGLIEDEKSELSSALLKITELTKLPVKEEEVKIDGIKTDLNSSHNKIFPNLSIDLKVGIDEIEIKPLELLRRGSKITFEEWKHEGLSWDQQGTGSQRALFWSMLQVRSRLDTIRELQIQKEKHIKDLEKQIKKLERERDIAKKEETVKSKSELIDIHISEIEKLKIGVSEPDEETGMLPGYMLLIDEPEIALHPNAIRAASNYLYQLADDPSWQVMITTHSPSFIDPLKDHTTIVRLDREVNNPTPKTYISDKVKFSDDEKENLKMLNRFDSSLAEMFFGQYPIIIEGDTEFSAFEFIMNKFPEKYPLERRPILIRARGKYTIPLIIKMLQQFKVSFSILHDLDFPYIQSKKGAKRKNNAWSANEKIFNAILDARKEGLSIKHLVSTPYFEAELGSIEIDSGLVIEPNKKDKPFEIYSSIKEIEDMQNAAIRIFDDLINVEKSTAANFTSYEDVVNHFQGWVKKESITDMRYQISN